MDTGTHTPKYCVWELTLQCNMNCIHCGSRAGHKRENELSNEEALRVAAELVALSCEYVTFIGGEIFLYKGWEKIARKMTDSRVTVNVITNGFLFGDKQVEEVRYANLSNVALSIDGMEENHNRIRNNSNSFHRVRQTMDRLNKEHIPIGVNTTLLESNVHDLEKLYDFLLGNNVRTWQLQLANPMGNLSSSMEQMISIENIKKLTAFIREKRDEAKMRVYTGDNIGYYGENEKYIRGLPGNINYWSGCQAGLSVVGIDSIGNIKGCESLYDDIFIEGNLRKETLSEIWFNENNFSYNRKFDPALLEGKCKECDMGIFCRAGCRGACYFTKQYFFENAYCTYEMDSIQDSRSK
ncbi:MAG: radical SAM protein [Chlorobiaceae bacterium]|nr:radical SAM protein [Chlorobiaceae bacterium]